MHHYITAIHHPAERKRQPLFTRRLLFVVGFLLCAGAALFHRATPAVRAMADAGTPGTAELRRFEGLSARTGWILLGNELYRTADGGDSWRRITPQAATPQVVADLHFLDEAVGWVLLLTAEAPGRAWLARTGDGGQNWALQEANLPGWDPAATGAAWHVTMVDAQTGWIAVELATSRNFSAGRLWQTTDGGATWASRRLPAGEPVAFRNAQVGWTTGGATGGELWRTVDGGRSWHEQTLPLPATTEGDPRRVYLPIFARDGVTVMLPVLGRTPAGQRVEWYLSRDGGASWQWERSLAPEHAAGMPLADSDPRAWLVAQSGAMPHPAVQTLPFFANPAIEPAQRLVALAMTTSTHGWALAEPGRLLLRTDDGGASWRPLHLPATASPDLAGTAVVPGAPAAPIDTGARTSTAQGAAFDICELPSLGELRTWWSASPYRIVNLYIGGVMRFCDNENLTAQTVEQLAAEGWKFIPTWVGLQAPCSEYRARFSSDPGMAYAQGMNEADAALAAAQELGLTEPDGSGTIVYYDLESFDGGNEACMAAARAFVSGWTRRMHERSSQAGLYGSACNPRMAIFADLPDTPDAVWVAQWNRSSYDPAMTVWNIECLDNSLWPASQRIRQYTPGHDETWGGVTLNIDSNVVDSIVADPRKVMVEPQPAVTLESPVLTPPYADDMCGAGWHLIVNERGYPAYLAGNRNQTGTIPPPPTPNRAHWEATAPTDGYYRVEAFIPQHGPIDWLCPAARLSHDTSSARYTVDYVGGSASKIGNQAAYAGAWLLLGIFPFKTAITATVTLETSTEDPDLTRTVAASALRLQRVEQGMTATDFVYLPAVRR